ncbi:MAG TPA: VacB/RNase II family 3'-5' exoribonuclease [Phycisphaerae bacterium]|nr:VacB/RNase II family 3'-5' exoribonuclease [Phycisphaerae bacterium]
MTQLYHEPIINLLSSQNGQPVRSVELADRLNIAPGDRPAFERAVDELAAGGRVVIGDGRLLTLPAMGNKVTGTYRQTQRGFGFVIPEETNSHGDLFIPIGENLDAVTGDFVVAKVIVRDKYDTRDKKNIFGRIIEVLKRATNKVVGTLTKQNGRWIVQPDGKIFRSAIEVGDVGAKNAAENDKVVVELLRFPQGDEPAQGVITEVLGAKGEPEVELQSVIRQYDLPAEFPEAVLEQARQAARSYDPEAALGGDREDLRGELIVTIDPDDARDFDDAISLRYLKGAARFEDLPADGASDEDIEQLMDSAAAGSSGAAWELGVHIADVSHFVGVESAMDMEARNRGNSTYFPGYVIPMLPEILSNGVCSLQENQPRLCKSAFIRYDAQGRVVGTRFANTLIHSKKRLTYKQAQAVIDDAKGEGQPYTKGLLEAPPNPNVPIVSDEVRKLLLRMDRLARIIRHRRLEEGMIVLDLPEVELVINEEGHVIDAQPEDDSFTHKIIEMFMVEANEAVSRWLTKAGLPVLRRIHPDPDVMDTEQVRQFMMVAGRKVPRILDRKALQQMLDSVRGTPVAYAVHLAVLKTMSSAEYSPQPIGHYALASDNYAHFTSPIRRYADLVIHRCFDAVLTRKHEGRGKKQDGRRKKEAAKVPESDLTSGLPGQRAGAGMMPDKLGMTPDYATLVVLGKHLSFTERRSADAERDLRAVKVLQLLAEHIGDVIDGVVTGVTGFGVFVQSTRFLVEGMIRVADLPDDFWQFDERTGVLRGQRTGRRIALGDRAKVQIVNVNVPARQLDLRLLEHGSSIGGDTAMRRMEPRRQSRTPGGPVPAGAGSGAGGPEDLVRPFRKKNAAKREDRKEEARQRARQERRRTGGGEGERQGGRGKRSRRGRGRFRR